MEKCPDEAQTHRSEHVPEDEKVSPIAAVLETPPPKLKTKEGPRNVPVNREAKITLISVTVIAVRKP